MSVPPQTAPSLSTTLHLHSTQTLRHAKIFPKLLRQYSRGDHPENGLKLFDEMWRRGAVELNRFTFPPLLKAVTRVRELEDGVGIHGLVVKSGFGMDPFIGTALVGMYAACGSVAEARMVFDRMSHRDVVAWGIMIHGYCQSNLCNEAVQLFEDMKNANVEPDEMILSTIISACGRAGNLTYGKVIHEYITDNNITLDAHLQTALVSMYASCGCMDLAQQLFEKISSKNLVVSTAMISWYSRAGKIDDARTIFNQMDRKDLVCWSAMISGYAESDQPQEALALFHEMQDLGVKPDQVTILSVISACSHFGSLSQAQWIHKYVDVNGFGEALPIKNALIDMYGKCGSLDRAWKIFDSIPTKNVISWTSMISALAMHGEAHDALMLFRQMKNGNIEPNGITFIGVLYACSHAGLVEEAQEIFSSMINEHNLTPKLEHYGCMVDLFGRASLLRKALEIIETMPLAPNVIIWGSLMAACRIHGENELGEFAAKQLLKLDPAHDGAHVFLSNLYAKERRWQDVGELRNLMRECAIYKERGCSWIEINSELHEFAMAERNHKEADKIYEKLNEMVRDLKLAGYAPSTHSVLVDLRDDEKKEAVLWHSEKLALSYGFISERTGYCIRIMKNLRICEDCHTFMKLASKIYKREIIVRDRTRFHHCKDGMCSCKDYW